MSLNEGRLDRSIPELVEYCGRSLRLVGVQIRAPALSARISEMSLAGYQECRWQGIKNVTVRAHPSYIFTDNVRLSKIGTTLLPPALPIDDFFSKHKFILPS